MQALVRPAATYTRGRVRDRSTASTIMISTLASVRHACTRAEACSCRRAVDVDRSSLGLYIASYNSG